jgi:hypothetical protein
MARALIAGLAALVVLAPAAQAKKPLVYRVKVTFTQTRPWTYHYVQSSPDCVRTDNGDGLDVVKVVSKAVFTVGPGAASGFGALAEHRRTGSRTHNVSGGECAPTAVFPSTWSIITETDGSVTATESNSGCGDKVATKPSFMTAALKGTKLKLNWDSPVPPEFAPCPYFEGSNDPSPGNELPSAVYRDIAAKVDRGALRRGKRRVTAKGATEQSAVENCANLTQHCADGVSYEATASVKTTVSYVLTRMKY